MWQDGLALLLVVIAVLALLRTYAPAGMFRFGARRGSDGSVKSATHTGGCGGCPSESSCFKVRVKVYPVTIRRREPFPSSGHRPSDRTRLS
jgi:hypothetical protein